MEDRIGEIASTGRVYARLDSLGIGASLVLRARTRRDAILSAQVSGAAPDTVGAAVGWEHASALQDGQDCIAALKRAVHVGQAWTAGDISEVTALTGAACARLVMAVIVVRPACGWSTELAASELAQPNVIARATADAMH